MRKKGQAAMEFLMTYGWAILVVLAAIGALAYFGVLSPRNILPSSCTVGAGFGCKDTKATSTTMTLTLLNNLGSDLTSASIRFTGDVHDYSCLIDMTAAGWGAVAGRGSANCDKTKADASDCWYNYTGTDPLRTGKAFPVISFSSCTAGAGSKFSGNAVTDFTITYMAAGETQFHQVNGKANLKVET